MEQFLCALLEFSRTSREFLSSTPFSVFIGLSAAISYLAKNRARHLERELLINAAAVFGGSLIIPSGLAVIILGFDVETCGIIKIDPKFVVVGGFIMAGLGYQTLMKNYNL